MSVELARSNADLLQFAYVAAHDLQVPLHAVEGFLNLLAKRYRNKLDAKADEYIEHTIDCTKNMKVLIKNLLAYSQISTKGKEFKPTYCLLALNLALANLRTFIEKNKVVVTHDSMPTVMANELQLSRLFQNLIGNAIKVRGKEEAPRIHISVE